MIVGWTPGIAVKKYRRPGSRQAVHGIDASLLISSSSTAVDVAEVNFAALPRIADPVFLLANVESDEDLAILSMVVRAEGR